MTDNRLQSSIHIDRMSASEIVGIIQEEDRKITGAIEQQRERIAQAVDAIADRLSHGGRLFYAGAGTSGRIAMLDAAELPPTYGIDPSLVQVIIAGGEKAYFAAVEGAEDDDEAAIAEIERRVTPDDCVVGIAASGTTPFTVAAVRKANMIGALTVGLTSVESSPLASDSDIAIVPLTGPEVILGSTRMKSGTAQKMILNTLSTAVMIRLGRVYSNLMIDMPATNAKLRSRAALMVQLATGGERKSVDSAIAESGGDLRVAAVMVKRKLDAARARQLLEKHRRNLREVLES